MEPVIVSHCLNLAHELFRVGTVIVELEIVEALQVKQTDVAKCLAAMNRLDALVITKEDFKAFPDIDRRAGRP